MTEFALAATIPHLELVERCQRRDEDAFRQFFELFHARVRKIALKILKDETAAEDATQETFFNVFRAIGRFRGDSQVTTWLSRIAINVCFETIRKNSKLASRTVDDADGELQNNFPAVDTPFSCYCRREQDEILRGVLEGLGRKHRVVVEMHDFDGLTIKEIAERLKVMEGTVKSRLFYGRLAFKKTYTSRMRCHLRSNAA